MNSYKKTVALKDIRPGNNPRRDFGDIDALAATIEATGGQPVNPIVCVADGNVWRIVDGERRYRALKELRRRQVGDSWELATTDVLVFPDYGEAEEAVAMMATDDKRQLSKQEQARGFQSMLLLGVDDHIVAKAARRKVSDIRKAKEVAADAPEQATLDQMIAAAEFEGKDRAAVLKAKPEKWEAKAESIRRRIDEEARLAPLTEELARLGIEVVDKQPGRSDGFGYGHWCGNAEAIAKLAEEGDVTGAVAVRYQYGVGYNVHLPLAEEDEPEETEEERAKRETRERMRAALQALCDALMTHVAENGAGAGLAEYVGQYRAVGYDWQRDDLRKKLVELGVTDEGADAAVASPASDYEVLRFVDRHMHLDWWQFVLDVVPLAAEGGFQPSEEDGWLRELALDARSDWERRQAEIAAAEAEESAEDEGDQDEDGDDDEITF